MSIIIPLVTNCTQNLCVNCSIMWMTVVLYENFATHNDCLALIQVALLYLAHVNSLSQQIITLTTHLPDVTLRAKKLHDTDAMSSVHCSTKCIEELACIYSSFHEKTKSCTLLTQGSTVYDLFGSHLYAIVNTTVLFKNKFYF